MFDLCTNKSGLPVYLSKQVDTKAPENMTHDPEKVFTT